MNQTRLRGGKFDTIDRHKQVRTFFTLFGGPDSIRNTRKLGADGLFYIETMTKHPERTARASTAGSQNLGSIRVRQNVHYFRIQYRI